MPTRIALGLFALALFASDLSAQAATSARFITGQVGVFVASVPAYPGSDERWVVPLPVVDLRVARRIYVGGGISGISGGAGVILAETSAITWSADFTVMPDRPEDRADALAGLGDRGLGGYAGTTILLRQGRFDASASVATGVEREMGTFATAGLGATLPLPTGWFSRVGALAVVGDDDNLRWDFGVSPAQATQRGALLAAGAPGLRAGDDVAYRPDGGLRELRGSVLLARTLGPRLTLSGTTSLVRLEGGAARSPLTRERTSWEAGAGLTWRF